MKLPTFLLLLCLPLAAKCHYQEQHQLSPTPAIDASLDMTALITQLKHDITEAVRKEVREEARTIYKAQQHLASSSAADDHASDFRKLTNDIITAVREEIWSVNQLQLAAFYENHNHTCANSNSHANTNAKVNASLNLQIPLIHHLTEAKSKFDFVCETKCQKKVTVEEKGTAEAEDYKKSKTGLHCFFSVCVVACITFATWIIATFIKHNYNHAKKIVQAKKQAEAGMRLWRGAEGAAE